jgi:hypothetical protein
VVDYLRGNRGHEELSKAARRHWTSRIFVHERDREGEERKRGYEETTM